MIATFALVMISACETTRETTTANIGGKATKIASDDFDKKKAASIRVNNGLTYLNHNNYERAKYHLDHALQYDPNSGNVHYALGIYYQRVSSFDKSQAHFDKALAAEPQNPLFLNAYGAFLCDKGQYQAADKAFNQAIAIPTYSDVAFSFYNVGFCALKQKDTEKAENFFREALKRNRYMGDALIEMAKLEFNKKRYARTASYITRFEKSARMTAESAWLGLRAAHFVKDKDAVGRYGLILEHRFPDSDETASYLDEKKRWM